MDVRISGMAGTLESSDVTIVVEPNENKGIVIDLKSQVEKQFGGQIKALVLETLKELRVSNVIVKIQDKGALDCVIKARLQTAILRAAEMKTFNWGE